MNFIFSIDPTTLQTRTEFVLIVSQLLYFVCFIPQIITNYRCRSGKGLSDLFLLGNLNGYITLVYYVFCKSHPLIYRITAPACMIALLVLAWQRLQYDSRQTNPMLPLILSANILLAVTLIPFTLLDPDNLGTIFGWLNVIISSVNQFPQVLKIYRSKSVQGFSIMYVLIFFTAALCEATSGIMLGLPIQTLINAMRTLLISLIFLWQFRRYAHH